MPQSGLTINPGKLPVVGQQGRQYYCYAIHTPLITEEDSLGDVVRQYIAPVLERRDIVFVSEKMVACTQGRAIPLERIRAGWWARLLCRFVVKRPGGIGLGMPETMQCAIDECGLPRILLAAGAGALGKLLGVRGWFYRVAGPRAAAIDGPCHWTIAPYNRAVVLAPQKPDAVAAELSKLLDGATVLIVDLNDFGGRVLGGSCKGLNEDEVLELLRQNPLGQSSERTPVGILRPR